MGDASTTHGVLFTGLFNKPLTVEFDQARSSTDGGAVLLKVCDERLRLDCGGLVAWFRGVHDRVASFD